MFTKRRRWFIALVQSLLVVCSVALAWLLRFEFTFPKPGLFFAALPLLLLFRMASMKRYGLFHGYWRYAGLNDFEDIVKSVVLGSFGFLISLRYVIGERAFPLSIYILEALITAGMLGGLRFASRRILQQKEVAIHRKRRKTDVGGRILVVGAGEAAYQLIHELPRHGYIPVACVDDDAGKLGARIHGVPVVGKIEEIPELVVSNSIDEILIAIVALSGSRMREVIGICQSAGTKFRTIPALGDLVNGKVTVSQLREVQLEDLLGREPVRIDLENIRKSLSGKAVLVTGAAGSIGSELCLQILSYEPSKLLCVDQDESALFYLNERLQNRAGSDCVEYVVADIADRRRMREVMVRAQVAVTFHAAAYKHVPMMEFNVSEAVRNNILGLMTLLEEAQQAGCGTFVMISSDKAVHPTSVMGCTKRVGELILAARPKSAMRCVSVRFGNVLGSQGSVVPTFKEQISNFSRVTVTHPEITRFFMTIPEAVSLVLQAFTVGNQGEIMVLDMGEPVRIVDLARTLIRLMGKSEDDVEIAYTGLRKGEKLFEELFYSSEEPSPTSCDKVLSVRGDLISWAVLKNHLMELDSLLYAMDPLSVRAKLRDIVPEYSYSETAPSADHRLASQSTNHQSLTSLTLLDASE